MNTRASVLAPTALVTLATLCAGVVAASAISAGCLQNPADAPADGGAPAASSSGGTGISVGSGDGNGGATSLPDPGATSTNGLDAGDAVDAGGGRADSGPGADGGDAGSDGGGTDGGGDAGAFGDAVVAFLRVGDGKAALLGSGGANAGFVDGYRADGSLAASVPVAPTFTSSTLEGGITLSDDGHHLVFAGHSAAAGALDVTATGIAAVIGQVDATGAATVSGKISGLAQVSTVRSAATIDGSAVWVSDEAGVYDVTGATASTIFHDATPRDLGIFGERLYFSSASGSLAGLQDFDTALPTTAATAVALPGPISSASSAFVMFDTNGDGTLDLVYLATLAGVEKWTLGATDWSKTATTPMPGAAAARGVTGTLAGTAVTLYATTSVASGNVAVTIADTVSAAAAGTVAAFVTAATDTALRGVALVPVAAAH